MKRPFDPSVDCHIDFLQHHTGAGIASGAARLLIGAQEALLKVRQQVTAVRTAAEPDPTAVWVPIAAEAARTLDDIEREAGGYLRRLGQLECRQDSAARREIREVQQAHAAVAYVLQEKRSELEKLIPAPKGEPHAA